MPEVEAKSTAWSSPRQFARDMVEAGMRAGLSQDSACILAAHMSLSCGWGKHLHNYNFCGIKATNEAQSYFVKTGFECGPDGKPRPRRPMKWRSYDSVEAGVAGILSVLSLRRYAPALAALRAADSHYFTIVGQCGWYTAPQASMQAQMRARLKSIREWLALPTATLGDAASEPRLAAASELEPDLKHPGWTSGRLPENGLASSQALPVTEEQLNLLAHALALVDEGLDDSGEG